MGKYTNLAHQLREEEHNKVFLESKSVKMNSMEAATDSNPSDRPGDRTTPLRPYAVNAVIRCIHDMDPDSCGVCSGYVRWLVEDEDRLRRAQVSPEKVRREFWRCVRGGG